MTLKLVFPSTEHAKAWAEITNEFEAAKEMIIPYALKPETEDYDQFLEKTLSFHENKNVPEAFVASSTYFLMNESDDKILGAVNIRHSLNDYLLKKGGHIGYGIAPSERQKGYAKVILKLALLKCKDLGLKQVLVTCDGANVGSSKTIIYNGGVLENELIEESGHVTQRYWITIDG